MTLEGSTCIVAVHVLDCDTVWGVLVPTDDLISIAGGPS